MKVFSLKLFIFFNDKRIFFLWYMNVFSLIENEAVERCCPLWSEWVLHKHVKKHVFFLSWIKHFYFNPERFFILPSWNEHHCLLWSEWVRKKLEKINQQQKNDIMTKKHLYINPEFLSYMNVCSRCGQNEFHTKTWKKHFFSIMTKTLLY